MTTGVADANFLLGYRNHVLYESEATLDCTLGEVVSGSMAALRTMQLSERVTITNTSPGEGAATIQLHWAVDPGSAVGIQLIGLLNYTVSAPGATSVSWSITIAKAGGGALSDEPITVYERPSDDFPSHVWAILEEAIEDGYDVIMSISASFDEGGGTLTFTSGGLWLSPLWWLPNGLATGWKETLEDSGLMRVSKGRQGYPSRGPRGRVFSGRAVGVPFEWAYGSDVDPTIVDVQQLQYRCGTCEPIVIFPRTRNRANARSVHVMHRLGVYGHFRELGWIEEATGDNYNWSEIVVAELM